MAIVTTHDAMPTPAEPEGRRSRAPEDLPPSVLGAPTARA